jgi:O-methyltransferase domain
LGVFDELGRGPRTLAQLRHQLGLHPVNATDLLDALLGLGWVERDGDDQHALYISSRRASQLLDRRSATHICETLQAWHLPLHGAGLALAELLRGTTPKTDCASNPAQTTLREGLASLHGQSLAAALVLPGKQRLLVVQGAAGRVAAALALAHPAARCQALEPALGVPRARAHLATLGLANRVRVSAMGPTAAGQGDPAAWPWPPCDLLILHHALLPVSAGQRAQNLQLAHTALHAGGTLVVVDHMLDAQRRRSATALTLALVCRAAGDDIALVDAGHWQQLAAQAGFEGCALHPLAGAVTALTARRGGPPMLGPKGS